MTDQLSAAVDGTYLVLDQNVVGDSVPPSVECDPDLLGRGFRHLALGPVLGSATEHA
jgi:hypothetical protein